MPFATARVATVPPAPPRLSITICWPSVSLILSATLRAIVLALPPGANGTTSVIGRVGKVSPTAGPNTAGRSAATNAAGRTQAPRMEGLPNLLASNQLAWSLVGRRTRAPWTWRILAFPSIFATATQMG